MTTLEHFSAEAIAFLETHAKRRPPGAGPWGEGSDGMNLLEDGSPEDQAEQVRQARVWKAEEFDAGFGWITGPVAHGGRDLPLAYDLAYSELRAGYDVPSLAPFGISLGMVGPTILATGPDEMRTRYLRRLWRGELIGCQLFSEPAAGSDLASLQTTAVRDGDSWVITGQKVWTSYAHFSDIGEILCRTDPSAPRHRGLTAFIVDMGAPGIEIRPLRQITGGSGFNEVFLTEVRVPDDHRLGAVNDGWRVALTTLMNERASVGTGLIPRGPGGPRLLQLAQHLGAAGNPIIRQRLAEIYIQAETARFSDQRALARLRAGQAPGPEMSLSKLAVTMNLQRMAAVATELLGPRLAADTGEWGTYAWGDLVLGVAGMRLAGGTDEVMRTVVAERVLGLPKEPAS